MAEVGGLATDRVSGRRSEDAAPRRESGRASRSEDAVSSSAPAGGRYRGTKSVEIISPTTAVYDRGGAYPALFLFQVARPRIVQAPLSGLYAGTDTGGAEEMPETLRRSFVSRFAPRAAGTGVVFEDFA